MTGVPHYINNCSISQMVLELFFPRPGLRLGVESAGMIARLPLGARVLRDCNRNKLTDFLALCRKNTKLGVTFYLFTAHMTFISLPSWDVNVLLKRVRSILSIWQPIYIQLLVIFLFTNHRSNMPRSDIPARLSGFPADLITITLFNLDIKTIQTFT